MMHPRGFVLATVLLGVVTTPSSANTPSQCTTCALDREMMVKGPPCDVLPARTNGLFDTDTDCKDIQLEHYQMGCCPMPPMDHCTYCEDGTLGNMDNRVPTGQFVGGYTCFDYMYQAESRIGLFKDGECSDTFLQRAGHYCGCAGQEQQCWLCPDGNPPNKPAKGDPWISNANCRGIEYLFSLLTEEECAVFPLEAGADLSIFCGCGGLNETEIEEQKEIFQCTLCENGGNVTNPDYIYTKGGDFVKTCRQAEEFAREIIKTPAGCRNTDYFGEARANCTCSNPRSKPSSATVAFSTNSWSGMWTLAVGLLGTTALAFY